MNSVELFKYIQTHYDLDGIKTLCFYLKIRDENIPGDTLDAKARELVNYCERIGRLEDLEELVVKRTVQNRSKEHTPSPSQDQVKKASKSNNYARHAFSALLLIGLVSITALVAWNASKQLNPNGLPTASQTSTSSDIVATLETPTSTLTPTDSPTGTLTSTATLTPTIFPTETPTPYGKVIEDTLVYFYPSTNSDSRGVVLSENEVNIFGKTENGIWLNVLATFNEQLHRGWLEYDSVELQDHWNIELIPTVMTVPAPPPTSTSPPPATPTIPIPEDNNTSPPSNNNSSNESKEPDNSTPEKKPTNPPTDGS